jgi:hypothetical protein
VGMFKIMHVFQCWIRDFSFEAHDSMT